MSILIKDMKMPPTCWHCNFKRVGQFGGVWCALTKTDIPRESTKRLKDCPLIDIGEFAGEVSFVDKINDNDKVEVTKTIFVKEILKFYEVKE